MDKRILLFLLLLPAFCLANDTFLFDYFPIEVWGDIDFTRKWFNYIAMMCNVKINKTNLDLFSVAVTLCALFSVWTLFQNGLESGIKEVASNMILTLFLVTITITSNQTVTILDARVQNGGAVVGATSRAEVANIPYPIAFMASAFTNFSSYLLKRTEVLLAEQDAPLYTEVGMLRHLYFSVPKTDPFMKYEDTRAWKADFQDYIENCFLEYGDKEDMLRLQNQVTLDILNPANMHSPVMTANGGALASYQGQTCATHFQNLSASWNNIKTRVDADINRAYELTPQSLGVMQAKAQYNKQIVQDQIMGLGDFKNYIVQPLLQDMARVATLSKNLGSGGGATGTSALTASESFLQKKRADGSALADWLANARLLEKAYIVLSTFAFGIFPLIVIFALPRTLKGKIRVMGSYVGGCFGISLMPFGLMIAHTIATRDIFSEAQKITGAGGEYFIGYEHYSNMLDQAYVSSILAGLIVIALPTVLMTGGVISLLNLAGRSMASGVGNVESTMSEVGQAHMDQRTGVTAGDLAMAGMMSDIQQSTASKLGTWQEMDGKDAHGGAVAYAQAGQQAEYNNALASATKGSEFDYQKAGAWQGAKSAGQSMEIGSRYREGFGQASGQALAEGAGRIAGVKETASAIGAYQGGFMNKEGELSTNQSNLLKTGMINSERANLNKIAGLGLDGYFNSSQMSDLQHASRMGMEDQFAQGRAFKEGYGSNFSAYGKDSLSKAEQKMGDFMGTAKAFRDAYGSGSSAIQEYASDTQAITDKKLADYQGDARAFKNSYGVGSEAVNIRAKDTEATQTLKNWDAMSAGKVARTITEDKEKEAQYKNSRDKLEEKNIKQILGEGKGIKEAEDNVHNKLADIIQSKNKDMSREDALKEARNFDVMEEMARTSASAMYGAFGEKAVAKAEEKNGNFPMSEDIKEGKKLFNSEVGEKLKSDLNALSNTLNSLTGSNINLSKTLTNAVNNIDPQKFNLGTMGADEMVKQQIKNEVKNFEEEGVRLSTATSMGYINSSGTLTNLGAQTVVNAEAQRLAPMMTNASQMNNNKQFSEMLKQTGMSQAQINDIMSSNGGERAIKFALSTATAQFSGTVGGRTFNMRAGADGAGWNGSFDSSINVRGGYNVNMGSALGASGWAMGGVSGMRSVGIAQTTYEGVMGVADIVTDFIPNGRGIKKLKNLAGVTKKGLQAVRNTFP